MTHVPAPTWEVVDVPDPALVTKDGAASAVAHSEWVRLFLGRSLAPAKLMEQPGQPRKVEYLVQGVPFKHIAVDELRVAAVKAAERDLAQLKEALASQRRDIEAARDGSASMHPELFLNSFRVLASVTVSRDPDDWRVTDEGLSIVRWGLVGERSEPLLAWTDQELDAQLRRATEGLAKVARPQSASETAAGADERRLKAEINKLVQTRVERERARLEREVNQGIKTRLQSLSQASAEPAPLDPVVTPLAAPTRRRQGVAPWIAITSGVAALLFLGASVWLYREWRSADDLAQVREQALTKADSSLDDVRKKAGELQGKLGSANARLEDVRTALRLSASEDPLVRIRSLLDSRAYVLSALNEAAKHVDPNLKFDDGDLGSPNRLVELGRKIEDRNRELDAQRSRLNEELPQRVRGQSLEAVVASVLNELKELRRQATAASKSVSTISNEAESWKAVSERLASYLGAGVASTEGSSAADDFVAKLPSKPEDRQAQFRHFLERWDALMLKQHGPPSSCIAIWCRSALLAPIGASPLDRPDALMGVTDAAAVDAILAASAPGSDSGFRARLDDERVKRGLPAFERPASPCDGTRLEALRKELRDVLAKDTNWGIRECAVTEPGAAGPRFHYTTDTEAKKIDTGWRFDRYQGSKAKDVSDPEPSAYTAPKQPEFGKSPKESLESSCLGSGWSRPEGCDCCDALAIHVLDEVLQRAESRVAASPPTGLSHIPAGLALRLLKPVLPVLCANVSPELKAKLADLQTFLFDGKDPPHAKTWVDDKGQENDISKQQGQPLIKGAQARVAKARERLLAAQLIAPRNDLVPLGCVLFAGSDEALELPPDAVGCELFVVVRPSHQDYKVVKIGKCGKDGKLQRDPSAPIPEEAKSPSGLVVLRGRPPQGQPANPKK